jgi:hypothetical protein
MAAGAAIGFGIIVLIFGVFIGWFARHAYGMHGDMKVNKARVPTFRGNRNRAALVVLGLVILVLLFIRAAA